MSDLLAQSYVGVVLAGLILFLPLHLRLGTAVRRRLGTSIEPARLWVLDVIVTCQMRVLGKPSRWRRRLRRRRRMIRRSERRQARRSRFDGQRKNLVVAVRLAHQTWRLAASAVLLLALTEVIGSGLAGISWPVLHVRSASLDLGSRWNPLTLLAMLADPGQYNTLAATAVGAEATLLALFYATVGVVASTAYSSVPADIRQLFVESRIGAVYTRGIVRAFVYTAGLSLLAAFGFHARAVTLVTATFLALLAALRLLVVGTAPFNFFDPAALTETLPNKFARALKIAALPPTATDEGSQRRAHREAAVVLDHYRRIVDLLTSKPVLNSSAPLKVAQQLLALSAAYASTKDTIPSNSNWWGRITKYPNWFLMSPTELQLALATSTGSQGSVEPDHLWVERQTSSDIGQLLVTQHTIRLDAFTGFVDRATQHLRRLAANLQMREAQMLEEQLGQAIWHAVDARPEGDEQERFVHQRDRVVASQRAILLLTNGWLGVIDAANAIRAVDLSDKVDRAVSTRQRIERVPAPRELLQFLEDVSERLSFERASEGRTVSPMWWIHHHVARILAGSLVEACTSVLARFDTQLVPLIDRSIAKSDWDVASMTALAALEFIAKAQNLGSEIRCALAKLGESRSDAVLEFNWPVLPEGPLIAPDARIHTLTRLSLCLAHLNSEPFESTRLDLFGQTYSFLFDGAFDAILASNSTTAATLFGAVFDARSRATTRLARDLATQLPEAQVAYGLEPTVGMMELSGYAILMQEMDGGDTWEQLRAYWERDRNAVGERFTQGLVAALDFLDDVFMPTAGDIARNSRSRRLRQLFEDRGISSPEADYGPIRQRREQSRASAGGSRIVAAFAGASMGVSYDLADLFIVIFVQPLLPEGASLPRSARLLAAEIDEPLTGENDA